MANGIIFGAGRIGRGLLGEVFQQAGFATTFIDKNINLVDALNREGQYDIHKSWEDTLDTTRIRDIKAMHTSDEGSVADLICSPDAMVAVAVSPFSLDAVAAILALAIAQRALEMPDEPMDILLCDNSADPQTRLRTMLKSLLGGDALTYLQEKVGLVRTVVMRLTSEMPPDAQMHSALSLLNNGYPELPIDAAAFRGTPPSSPMIRLTDEFEAESTRKIYTLNMLETAMAYLGGPLGLSLCSEAIGHPRIRPYLEQALEEAAHGLCGEYGIARAAMVEWNAQMLTMLENPRIVSSLQRMGIDAARKVGFHERLIGPAVLCQKYDKPPHALARSIAYAYLYECNDPGTRKLRDVVQEDGIEMALERFSRLDYRNPLRAMVLEEYERAVSALSK